MIQFEAEKERLKVTTNAGTDCIKPFWHFHWSFGETATACMVAKYLQRRLPTLVVRIKATAYDEGYKDGKGKRKKETWFSDILA